MKLEQNMYGYYFKSPINYLVTTGTLKGEFEVRKPTEEEIKNNIKNLKSWGLAIDLENDLIYGSKGAVVCLLDKEYKISHIKKMPWYKKLRDEGYNLKIGTGYTETRDISYTSGIMSNLVAPKGGGIAPEYNILYCTNYGEFLREEVMVRKRKK